ncbi:NaeI family type II restriction endonuclease [Phytomonospora endophytica]|uniref:Type II restriction enzyme NaeI domain-containing protein n=1 Tax=Phytomonospora endophytica TaxID=714109 RepID=A0A841FMQ0_9ACTN|nr:NaeI family type II restriction endonuclease [Phytomonospora endophytica]MBB6036183.1 hypothetical protein [Phytomonospora endophytica]GIG67089.1 hypothetical protein Pen01_33840 [Phytomonospora endophytica]
MQEPLDFGSDAEPPAPPSAPVSDDPGLREVAWWLEGFTDIEQRFGDALRRSIDEVLDGQRTSRYDINQLEKTEKTYLGTKVEIVVRAFLELPRGARMDYLIAGHEVDAKFSLSPFGWTIPREAMNHLCLLMHADDARSRFTVGLLHITEDVLNQGRNQDGKRTVSKAGRAAIRWLVPDGRLPINALLHMKPVDRERILAAGFGQSGIDMLFTVVQERIVERETVVTIAAQTDSAKRVRDARLHLRLAGIVILGHQEDHPRIARDLNLPVPAKGEWISARLVPAVGDNRPATRIHGEQLVIAHPDDPAHPITRKY